MVKAEGEGSEPLAHVQNIDVLKRQTAVEFYALIDFLLKDAPNAAGEGDYHTNYDNQPPTDKAVEFKFRTSTVRASYYLASGSPPTYRLEIRTPIVVDNLKSDQTQRPQSPHEILEFNSSPFYGTVSLHVRAVNRLGDFGEEIMPDQYTAGGLLSPINTLGRGKLDTFKSAIALFKGVVLQNPMYKKPPARERIRR